MTPNLSPLPAGASSNIKAVGHEGKTLYVEFSSGQTWEYTPVTERTFKEMMGSASIGGYFHKWVRNNAAVKGKKVETSPQTPA